MTAAEQIQQWADHAKATIATEGFTPYDLLAEEAVPAMAAALQAVLAVHAEHHYLGEPGDHDCPHGNIDHDRHFDNEDGMWLCEDAKSDGNYCAGCPMDSDWEREAWPCPTVRAINTALGVES